ncbi:MAG: transposase [Myxococcales bacterium]|nr:transposase [Myxococcales bacterium]
MKIEFSWAVGKRECGGFAEVDDRDLQQKEPGFNKSSFCCKFEDFGGQIYTVDRFFPPSKACSLCEYIHNDLTLRDHTWTCPSYRTELDRDLHTAVNLKKVANSAVSVRGVYSKISGLWTTCRCFEA